MSQQSIEKDLNNQIVLSTDDGLVLMQFEGDQWAVGARALTGRRLTCLALQGQTMLAGAVDGLFRSADGGKSWQEVGQKVTGVHTRWLAFDPEEAGRALLGTEPAGLFQTSDGGLTWRERPEVARLRDEHNWYLPYSPEAGCVRGFAFHGRRAYASVEVGGLLRSDDGGENWRLVRGSDGRPKFGRPPDDHIHPDVHSVETHPSTADRIYAPTGGGFYVSSDGGARWRMAYDPCYCRAVWVDPGDPDHLILGPADSVDRRGRIEESFDGGQSWARIDDGLGAPWPRTMVERFIPAAGGLFALLSDGRVLMSRVGDIGWRWLFEEISGIRGLVPVT